MEERSITADDMATGHPLWYRAIKLELAIAPSRWIGRCRCGSSNKLEGTPVRARDTFGKHFDCCAVLGSDGKIYNTRVNNDHAMVIIKCTGKSCDRWVRVNKVHEKAGAKLSHKCGARCTNAVGPACDCVCKGANHGKNC